MTVVDIYLHYTITVVDTIHVHNINQWHQLK